MVYIIRHSYIGKQFNKQFKRQFKKQFKTNQIFLKTNFSKRIQFFYGQKYKMKNEAIRKLEVM